MRLVLAAFAAVVIVALVLIYAALSPALSQEHTPHSAHPQDLALHNKFYKNWMQPDNPNASCCSEEDCYPAEARFRNGSWYARQRETNIFVKIPAQKIEQSRDNPDGRSHVCMSPSGQVYCFSIGGGI